MLLIKKGLTVMEYNQWKNIINLLNARGWKRSPGPTWSYYKELARIHDGRTYNYWVFVYKEEITLISVPVAVLLDMKEYNGNKKLNQMILRDKVKRKWGLYEDE